MTTTKNYSDPIEAQLARDRVTAQYRDSLITGTELGALLTTIDHAEQAQERHERKEKLISRWDEHLTEVNKLNWQFSHDSGEAPAVTKAVNELKSLVRLAAKNVK